jgi:hypothetical protein
MCKPGSASGGSGVLGLAFAAVVIAGVVNMASAFIGTIITAALITAALITACGLAAAGTVLLVVILCRARGVVTWPRRTKLPSVAGRPAPAPRRVRPAPSLTGRAPAPPVTGAAARPAVPARQPLAIEAPASVPVPVGLPVGPGDLAVVAWQPASASLHREAWMEVWCSSMVTGLPSTPIGDAAGARPPRSPAPS